jgi:hypothetical protein
MSLKLKAAEYVGQISEVLQTVLETMPPEPVVEDAPDPGPRRTPRELRLWLARLRLLESVPFSHLVADSALLPPESIRFFHVDRAWTDALVEGALSVGTVTTGDRATLEAIYPVVRPEVDEAERLVRVVGWAPGAAVAPGTAGPITGFLLRSRMVSGWPAMSVRGYGRDNFRLAPAQRVNDKVVGDAQAESMQLLPVLRFERLAPAVLLVLFDGVPEVVHLEEPRAGVQFGIEDPRGGESGLRAPTREIVEGRGLMEDADGNVVFDTDLKAHHSHTVRVPFRKGAPGVVHVTELLERLADDEHTLIGSRRDSAVLAMQLLQFPFRSVYGDQSLQEDGGPAPDLDFVFKPQILYADVLTRIEDGPQAHPYIGKAVKP